MLKSKVIEIFKTFTAEEYKGFRNYILSPMHNSNKKVIKLFDLIRKNHIDYNSRNIKKEILFKKLYPSKRYSDIAMRILISDLLRLTEEYLAYCRYSRDTIAEKKYLLKELEHRNLHSLFKRHLNETEQIFEKDSAINNSYFMNRLEIENVKYEYLISTDRQDNSGNVLQKQGEYLVDFFLINGMNIHQQMKEMEEVLNHKFEINIPELLFKNINLDKFVHDLKEAGYEHYHIIEIYFLLYTFNDNVKSYEHHEKLKNAIIGNLHIFDETERYNLLLAYESCAVSRIRLGLKNSKEDLMTVYELMINEMSLTGPKKKILQANLFRNIFYTALMLKKLDWAQWFADKYCGLLLPEQKTDMINYTGAMISFERKKYDEALEYIVKVNHTFFVFKYEAKILMLKIYYELNSYESALSLIDSFSHFLTKNKNVSVTYKETFMTFLKFMKLLIRHRLNQESKNEFKIYELHKQAENTEHFMSKAWILEKIKQV